MSDRITPNTLSHHGDDNPLVKERVMKLVIVGDPKVGKTSLRRVFMGKAFKQNYLPTLGADFSLFQMEYGMQRVKTTLWDLSGQPKFSNVHPQYYLGAHGAVVIYDVNTEEPVENLMNWIDTYLEKSNRYTGPILIIQNKIDLVEAHDQISTGEEHDKLIDQLSIYYQGKVEIKDARTSAKTGENIHNSLENYIRDLVDFYDKHRGIAKTQPKFSEKPIQHVKAAYLITFENLIGPLIVAKSPENNNLEYTMGEESSVVNLSAGLNMDDLVERQYETATFMWTDPPSLMYYIAFVFPNPEARGGNDLYILGCNVSRDLKNLLSEEQMVIDGYLHQAMNEVVGFMNTHDFLLSDHSEIFRLHQAPSENFQIMQILHELRLDIDKLIIDKLKN